MRNTTIFKQKKTKKQHHVQQRKKTGNLKNHKNSIYHLKRSSESFLFYFVLFNISIFIIILIACKSQDRFRELRASKNEGVYLEIHLFEVNQNISPKYVGV